jgi:hypothetical protein
VTFPVTAGPVGTFPVVAVEVKAFPATAVEVKTFPAASVVVKTLPAAAVEVKTFFVAVVEVETYADVVKGVCDEDAAAEALSGDVLELEAASELAEVNWQFSLVGHEVVLMLRLNLSRKKTKTR